jgi:glycosyltransferase involved in cell wall biosynthesis
VTFPQFRNKADCLHVLVIPAWMATVKDPSAGSFILEQAIALQDEGHIQVGIIYQNTQAITAQTTSLLHAHQIPHVIHKIVYIPKASAVLIQLWCRRYLKTFDEYVDHFGYPDVLHAHSYIAGLAAAYISKRTHIPFMLTEHASNFLTNNVRSAHKPEVRKTLQQARKIIAVGEGLKRSLQTWTTEPILQIPNPVNEAVFYYDPLVAKELQFTVITVGSLIPLKRVSLVIQAIAAYRDIHLLVIGSGEEMTNLQLLARKLRVADRIKWQPHLIQQEVADSMRRSHVLISASEHETFGISVVEALMCGVPVICTASGGPEEYVDEQMGMLLSNNLTGHMLAEAIMMMRKNYTQYDSGQISKITMARFGRKTVIPALLSCYHDVLKQNT